MSIDALFSQPVQYQNKMLEDVFEIGLEIYSDLASAGNQTDLVRREEFFGFVYSTLATNMRDQMVQESLERKDYSEIFGMSKEEFITKSYSGEIEDFSVNPFILDSTFREATERFVAIHQLVLIDNSGNVENSPIQEVW